MLKVSRFHNTNCVIGGDKIEGLMAIKSDIGMFDTYAALLRDILESNPDVKADEGKIPLILIVTDGEFTRLYETRTHIHIKTIIADFSADIKYIDYINEVLTTVEEYKNYQLISVFMDAQMADIDDCLDIRQEYPDIPILVTNSRYITEEDIKNAQNK